MANIYQFTVELKNFKPRMWRRILVKDNMKLSNFSYSILGSFGATGFHLFQIEVGNSSFFQDRDVYSVNPEEDNEFASFNEFKDAKKKKLSALNLEENDTMTLWYDFGDDWMFKIKLEKIFPLEKSDKSIYPKIIKGKGMGIIDDCGGPYELADDPDFDFDDFDLEEQNKEILDSIEYFKSIYEEDMF